MNFWPGLIIGIIVGFNLCMVIAGMLGASKRGDDTLLFQSNQAPLDEAVMDEDLLAEHGAAGSRSAAG